MLSWVDEGLCLKKEDVMGEGGFWAPEIIYRNGLFYMVYVADEHLGVATATSPLGPFKQEQKKWLSERQAIDGHFFIDDDGTIYLYYVRFDRGNVLYVTTMSDDMLSIDEQNEKFIFRASEDWELKDESVVEGPFILKHNGKYYLTYSANHTRSPYYAIGYAVSDSPMGEFVKYSANPILKMNEEVNGVGHHSFVITNNGELVCVCHSHYSKTQFVPRTICLDRAKFVCENGEDKLVINGPTKSPQPAF
jgi:beta-xylosidase